VGLGDHQRRLLGVSATFAALLICVLLVLGDTPMSESLRIALVIGIQVITGGYAWIIWSKDESVDVPILVGMGIALGSFFSLMSQQLLRTTSINNFAWFLPTIILFAHAVFLNNRKPINDSHSSMRATDDTFNYRALSLIAWVSTFALASRLPYLYPVLLSTAPLVCCDIFCKSSRLRTNFRIVTLIATPVAILLSLHMASQGKLWWVYSHDQMFSETMSWSIFQNGPNYNPFKSGETFKYHWFSLGWAGLTTAASGAKTLTVISKALPIVAFIGMISLLWSLTKRHTIHRLAPAVAIFILVVVSNQLKINPVLFTDSPTFLFTSIWAIATCIQFFKALERTNIRQLSLLVILIFATYGGKFSSGATVSGGILVFIFARTVSRTWHVRKSLILMAAVLTANVASYLLIYSGATTSGTNALVIEPFAVARGYGLIYIGAPLFLKLIAVIPIVLMMSYLTSTQLFGQHPFSNLKLLILSIFMSGLGGMLIFAQIGVSQVYFMLAAMLFVTIPVADSLTETREIQLSRNHAISTSLLAMFCAIVSTHLWTTRSLSLQLNSYNQNILAFTSKFAVTSIPLLFAVTVGLIYSAKMKQKSPSKLTRSNFHFITTLFVVLTCVGFGIIERYNNAVSAFSYSRVHPSDPDSIIGSIDHVEVLSWIRKSTPDDSIIATNRFCIPMGGGECGPIKWQLVSALSHRTMFIEGGYYNDGLTEEERQSLERFDISAKFANQPNAESWRALENGGVDFFFVDHVVKSQVVSWEPYASIIKSNNSVTLLRINHSIDQ